ncbi:MAG: sugar phosphate nucleotidyltransferase [Clostridia bacterium]
MQVLILAADYAKELYPLTKETPKALLPLNKRPIIEFILDELAKTPNIDKVVIVSNHKFYKNFEIWLRYILAENAYPNLNISILDDGSKTFENALGPIGDIVFSIEEAPLSDDLLIISGDNFFTFSLQDFIAYYRSHRHNTLCAGQVKDIYRLRRMGVATVDDAGNLLTMVEKPKEPSSTLAVFGLYIFNHRSLPFFQEYLQTVPTQGHLGDYVIWLQKKKPFKVHLFAGDCINFGTPESYDELREKYKQYKTKVSLMN